MKPILQEPHEVLRTTSQSVELSDITTPQIQSIITEMKDTLASQEDGVALAAPQIGYNVRIFVVAPIVFKNDPFAKLVFINPVITKASKEKKWKNEGCLSVRWQYGKTHRHERATVTAYDQNGKQFTLGGSGLLAQIFQHEIDHLDATLFIDHAKDIHEWHPE
jgi:peptide deformylase